MFIISNAKYCILNHILTVTKKDLSQSQTEQHLATMACLITHVCI